MIDRVTLVATVLNQIANMLGRLVLSPIGMMPEILGAVVVSVVTGIVLLLAFKYTSNQRSIKRVRSDIKAQLLALSLFKESIAVSLKFQLRILVGAMRLVLLSLRPIVVMAVPVTLLLGQLSLWWQARPLPIGNETVVTITLRHDLESSSRSVEKRSSSNQISQVELTPSDSFAVTAGPVRVPSKRMVCWRIRGLKAGSHQLTFSVDGSDVTKELAIGDGLMRLGIERPDWNWSSVVLHPNEPPLAVSSPVKSIDVQYPYSSSWITGRNSWVAFWFIASTIAALSFSRLLGVNL